MIEYYKLESCGNDHILVCKNDVKNADWSIIAKKICNRNFGVGADGLIIYDYKNFIFYNQDGSIANLCGNAIRCHALYTYLFYYVDKYLLRVANEKIKVQIIDKKKLIISNNMPVISIIKDYEYTEVICIGNIKHVVYFFTDLNDINCNLVGKSICKEKVNVNFAQIISSDKIRLITYEKGVGLTKGCSSGAYCTYNMARKYGYIEKTATIEMNGGFVIIDDFIVSSTASLICKGEFYL